MSNKGKVIITCAITGAIHTPSMSPHLPVTAEQIADAALGAAEAGAAIVHLHASNPEDGRPDQTPEGFAPFLPVIKQRSNCVVNITTGGAPTMSIEERVRPAATFRPELASLNMGSMNFGLFGMLKRFKDLKHQWERDYLSNKDIIPNRRGAAGDRPHPQPDAQEVPRLPDPGPSPPRGAWQGRPDPLRLARCASCRNPPTTIVSPLANSASLVDRLGRLAPV